MSQSRFAHTSSARISAPQSDVSNSIDLAPPQFRLGTIAKHTAVNYSVMVSSKLSALFLFALVNIFSVNAQCVDFCYCSKSTADLLCNLPLLKPSCEVKQCTGECSTGGFRCERKDVLPSDFLDPPSVMAIRDAIKANGGCRANVCFAIDGSSSIVPTEYESQIKFVRDIVNVLDDASFDVRVAGTQYNTASHPISPLGEDLFAFRELLSNTPQKNGSTSISNGIKYCEEQLLQKSLQPGFAVVLGDGFENYDHKAVAAANVVRGNGGLVPVVAVQNADDRLLLDIAGNDQSLVFKASSFGDVQKLKDLIKSVTLAVCKPKP